MSQSYRGELLYDQPHGTLVLPFDLDEHTGGFDGAKQYFEGLGAPSDVAGAMIGYPGMDKLGIGGRGVYRTQLHVHGTSSHSDGSRATPSAIEKVIMPAGVGTRTG